MGKKKIGLLLGAILLVCLVIPLGAAVGDIRVYVDGTEVTFLDQKPVINKDNRTLVPIRFVTRALGGEVNWLDSSQTVEIKYSGKIISLTVGENFAWLDGQKKVFDTTTIIMNDRVMIPLRFVSECLGAYVHWNGATYEIFITKDYF